MLVLVLEVDESAGGRRSIRELEAVVGALPEGAWETFIPGKDRVRLKREGVTLRLGESRVIAPGVVARLGLHPEGEIHLAPGGWVHLIEAAAPRATATGPVVAPAAGKHAEIATQAEYGCKRPAEALAAAPKLIADWELRVPSLPDAELIDPTEPLDVARRFLASTRDADNRPAYVRWQGVFWKAHGTHYTECSDETINADLYRFADGKRNVTTGARVKPARAMVETVAHALRAVAALDVPEAPAWIGGQAANDMPPTEIIAFRNGLLHVPTRTFERPTRRFFNNMNALGFDYTPEQTPADAWLAFLEQVWSGDVESIEMLQEFMGLVLTGDTSYQKMFLMVGPPRSGKGTIARVLQALVGAGNYCAPTLNSLGTQFGLESLIGKTLAVISDARLSGRTDLGAVTENLLRISGEDTITVPRKHRTDWTAKLRVRFLILSNEVPALMDQSGALASRFRMLKMSRTFYGKEDLGLEARLTAELPGIIHWALGGLRRLRARGYFRQPASAQESLRQLETLGSPIKAFVAERCTVKPGATVACGVLYQAWLFWCSEQGREQPGTLPIFGRNLSAAFPELKVTQPRVDGKQVRHYEGIALMTPSDTR